MRNEIVNENRNRPMHQAKDASNPRAPSMTDVVEREECTRIPIFDGNQTSKLLAIGGEDRRQ